MVWPVLCYVELFIRFSFDSVCKFPMSGIANPLTQSSQCAMMHTGWLGGVSYCGYYLYTKCYIS